MSNRKILTREQILSADDLKREEVHVPDWGGSVFVRTLTGAERDRLEEQSVTRNGKTFEANFSNVRARLVSLAAVDESGKRLFTEADIEALGAKSATALDIVFAVASRINGLSAKDVDQLAKNSSADPKDASSSA
jgi:hypothetical protein